MVGVGEGDILVNVQGESLMISALAGQDDSREIDQGEYGGSNRGFRPAILALKSEDRLEDHEVGNAHLDLATFDSGEVGGGARGLVRMILEEVAQQNVRVEEREGHLSTLALDRLLGQGTLRRLSQLLGAQRRLVPMKRPGREFHNAPGLSRLQPDLIVLHDESHLVVR